MQERRKGRRFLVRQSAVLRTSTFEVHGISENVSEFGVLILADSFIKTGTPVDLTITLQAENLPTVQLLSVGRVVRAETASGGERVAIAVECVAGFQQWNSSEFQQNIANSASA